MVVDELWHDGDGDCARTLVKYLSNFFVLDADHILSIDFTEIVVDEETVTGGREGGREEESERRMGKGRGKGKGRGEEQSKQDITKRHYRVNVDLTAPDKTRRVYTFYKVNAIHVVNITQTTKKHHNRVDFIISVQALPSS